MLSLNFKEMRKIFPLDLIISIGIITLSGVMLLLHLKLGGSVRIIHFVLLLGLMAPIADLSAMLQVSLFVNKQREQQLGRTRSANALRSVLKKETLNPELFAGLGSRNLSLIDCLKPDSYDLGPNILTGPGIKTTKVIKFALQTEHDKLLRIVLQKNGKSEAAYKELRVQAAKIYNIGTVERNGIGSCHDENASQAIIDVVRQGAVDMGCRDHIVVILGHEETHGQLKRNCGVIQLQHGQQRSEPEWRYIIKHEISHLQHDILTEGVLIVLGIKTDGDDFFKLKQCNEKRADIHALLTEPAIIPHAIQSLIDGNNFYEVIGLNKENGQGSQNNISVSVGDVVALSDECGAITAVTSAQTYEIMKPTGIINAQRVADDTKRYILEYMDGQRIKKTTVLDANRYPPTHPSDFERIVYINELRKVLDRDTNTHTN